MSTSKLSKPTSLQEQSFSDDVVPPTGNSENLSGFTGNYLVLVREGAMDQAMALCSDVGIKVTSVSAYESNAAPTDLLSSNEAIVFEKLHVIRVNKPTEQFNSLANIDKDTSAILAIEPERKVFALDDFDAVAYAKAYRTAVNQFAEQIVNGGTQKLANSLVLDNQMTENYQDAESTWGLQATLADKSKLTGKGVRVAVLDTGFDLGHPDFVGRTVVAQSFIIGQTAQDGHGHGTHCIGTSCGPSRAGQGPRYGIACNAEIYVGKVLNNQGSGTDSSILAGIEWAINNKCAIISMSLGSAVSLNQPFSKIYEAVARRALAAGTLIIAAAGNSSNHPGVINPVGHPANCPSIMAIGALDNTLNIARFSDSGLMKQGGQIDIAAPGVNVLSSVPRPTIYGKKSGTSMATPHVAGIAALYAEANPDVRGGALGWLLLNSSKRINLPNRDVGAGLVQAP